ncbi:MAG: endonuclease/exonuclease/phosphatase family protein [Prevotella sp.]|nr:endonuclease/exonuclease/phosphatase family protein [Prevotella sp.]
MKILSYNIHSCNQTKINTILAMNADIMVLPECARQDRISLPEGYSMKWVGRDDWPSKGLGVIWNNQQELVVPTWYNSEYNYILPFIVNDKFLLLASWPTKYKDVKKSYPQILLEALRDYEPNLSDYPTMVCGDFNCFIGQFGISKSKGTFEQIIEFLENHGLFSLYHQFTGESFGQENKKTFYGTQKNTKPVFIDYAFTNIPTVSYELGEWNKEFSDHCLQMIVLYDDMHETLP